MQDNNCHGKKEGRKGGWGAEHQRGNWDTVLMIGKDNHHATRPYKLGWDSMELGGHSGVGLGPESVLGASGRR